MNSLVKIGLPALGFAGVLTGFTDRGDALPLRSDPPVVPTVTVQRTPARVARGEKLAQLLCLPCYADNDNRLTGRCMTQALRFQSTPS